MAAPRRATTSGRWPIDRSPMAGLFSVVRTSSTGAKSIETPTARNSRASAAPNRPASASSSARPSVRIGGHSVSGRFILATRPPS